MAYGHDSTGFEIKPYNVILDEMQQYIRDNHRSDYTIRPDTVDGMFFMVFGFFIYVFWQQLQYVYNAFIPSFATGVNLDNVNELRGSYRNGASATEVPVNIYGVAGTVIPENAIVSSRITGEKYYINTNIIVPNDGSGFGTESGRAICLTLGAIPCPAGTLTVIETSINGWLSITNPTDGIIGSEIEDDTSFRERAKREIALNGSSTYSAIYSNVSSVDGILDNGVFVFENDEEFTDTEGRPAHSFEVVVNGGDTYEIAKTIFENKPVGIQMISTADKSVIPQMTVNTDGTFEITVSSNTVGHDGFYVSDDDDATYWEASTNANEYWQFKLNKVKNILVFKIKASQDPLAAPKTIFYKAGNIESSLNILYTLPTQQNWLAGEERTFVIPYYNEEYLYQRLEFVDNNGADTIQVAKIQLLPYQKTLDITLFNGAKKRATFSRAIEIPVYMAISIKITDEAPSDIEAIIKQTIIDYGNTIGIGKDVIATSFYPAVIGIDGIDYAASIKIGTTASPTSDQIDIKPNEISSFSINNIEITYV